MHAEKQHTNRLDYVHAVKQNKNTAKSVLPSMTDTEIQYRMYTLKKQIKAIDAITEKINVIKAAKIVLINDHVFDVNRLLNALDRKQRIYEDEKTKALGVMASNLYVLYNVDDQKLRERIILMFSIKI